VDRHFGWSNYASHCLINAWVFPFQGCQMVYFPTRNSILGKFWIALEWKMSGCFMAIWNILQPFGIIFGRLA
jgi:hypothetical protein